MHAFMSMPNCWMQNAPWLLLGLYILKLHDCIKVAKNVLGYNQYLTQETVISLTSEG